MARLLIETIYRLFIFLLLARMIISFIRVDPYHPLVRALHNITEPILAPIRSMLPQTGMMDFSLMVAWLIAFVLRSLLITLLT